MAQVTLFLIHLKESDQKNRQFMNQMTLYKLHYVVICIYDCVVSKDNAIINAY